MMPADLLYNLYKINCPVFINMTTKRVASVNNKLWSIFAAHV